MNRWPAIVLLAVAGCIKAPEIVLTDRATALEEQAAGSFDGLERKLVRTGIAPRPVPLTPEQLEALGLQPSAAGVRADRSDADVMDQLLREHCVGEGNQGKLVDTRNACNAATDRAAVIGLIDRVNQARAQLWHFLQERRPDETDGARRDWVKAHARGVVCGGWIQNADGSWQAKGC